MLTATSCVEETEPTKFANQSQVNASSAATEALTYAMPMYFNNVDEDLLGTYNWHAAFGYGSMAIIRDMQTCDRSIGPKTIMFTFFGLLQIRVWIMTISV